MTRLPPANQPPQRNRLLRWNLAAQVGPLRKRSHFHWNLMQLVQGNAVTLKQASSFIRKINRGHLTLEQAELLIRFLDPAELRKMMNIMAKGSSIQARKDRFYAEDLPKLLLTAEFRKRKANQ